MPNASEGEGSARVAGPVAPPPAHAEYGPSGDEIAGRQPPPELEPAGTALPGERRVLAAAQRSLAGQARGPAALLPFLGPAVVAAVGYVDPGNFATNLAGGARSGSMPLWVVFAANLMAMLIQSMSAKLGIATGMNLPEICRDQLPFRVVVLLWLQAEAVAMATHLGEFVGRALGLPLVFGLWM